MSARAPLERSGRLPDHRPGLERTVPQRHEADILAEQFGARHRASARLQRQGLPIAYALSQSNSDLPIYFLGDPAFGISHIPWWIKEFPWT